LDTRLTIHSTTLAKAGCAGAEPRRPFPDICQMWKASERIKGI
jgi:hypothetical protein